MSSAAKGKHKPEVASPSELLVVVQERSIEEVDKFLKEHHDHLQYFLKPANDNIRTPLSVACEMNRGDVVHLLLQYGAEPNSTSGPNGQQPLHYACDHREWNVCIVRQLLEAGARVDRQMNDGQTALHIASCHGNIEVVALLLAHYADVSIIDSRWENALCKTKCASVAKLLIDAGSDVDCGCGRPILNAVTKGVSEIVDLLIKAGANVNNDPLIWIANRNKHHSIRKMLLKAGLSVKSSVVRMKSSVAKSTSPSILRLREIGVPVLRGSSVRSNNVKLAVKMEENHLVMLVRNGSLEEVDAFLKEHHDHLMDFLKPVVDTDRSPLSVACEVKRGDVVQLLLQYGADPNSSGGPSNKQPLHYACDHKEWNAGIVRQLLEAGAKVDQQATDGQTALHIASCHGNTKVVALLLAHYADVNKEDSLRENALCKTKCESVAKLLIDAGSDVDCGFGRPILNAVTKGDSQIVDLLIKAGANVNNDPLIWIANRKRYYRTRKLLVKAGVSVKSSSVRMKSTRGRNTNPSVLRMREIGLKKQMNLMH